MDSGEAAASEPADGPPAPAAAAPAAAAPAGGGRRSRLRLLLAGLLGAVIGFAAGVGVATLPEWSEPDNPPAAAGSPPAPGTRAPETVAPGTETVAPGTPPASPWPGEPAGEVFLTGTVQLTAGDVAGFDLDSNRTRWLIADIDLTATVDGVGAENGARIGIWDGATAPTLRDCRSLPAAAWTEPFIAVSGFNEGASFCLESTDGRLGFLTAQRVDRTTAGEPRHYHFHYVLWRHPDDR